MAQHPFSNIALLDFLWHLRDQEAKFYHPFLLFHFIHTRWISRSSLILPLNFICSVRWPARGSFLTFKYIFKHYTQRLDWSVNEIDEPFTLLHRQVIKHFIHSLTSHLPFSTDKWSNISFTPLVLSKTCEEDIWQPNNTYEEWSASGLSLYYVQPKSPKYL